MTPFRSPSYGLATRCTKSSFHMQVRTPLTTFLLTPADLSPKAYIYLVTNFGNPAYLGRIVWSIVVRLVGVLEL